MNGGQHPTWFWVVRRGIDGGMPVRVDGQRIDGGSTMPTKMYIFLEKLVGGPCEAPSPAQRPMLERLQREYPGRFPDSQLRTLQRRIREWRRMMARELVFACLEGQGSDEAAGLIGDKKAT
jgi:hypothetical protein